MEKRLYEALFFGFIACFCCNVQATDIYIKNFADKGAKIVSNTTIGACHEMGSVWLIEGLQTQQDARAKKITDSTERSSLTIPLPATGETLRLCAFNTLIVEPLEKDKYTLKGLDGKFYGRMVVPGGQVWNADFVPVSQAGGQQIIEMPL